MAYKFRKKQTVAQAGSLLQLLIEQFDAAMTDNNDAMKTLIECHKKIAENLEIAQHRNASKDTQSAIQQELNQTVMQMVVAFQQHDAFNQRLQHAIEGLAETKALIENDPDGQTPHNWQQLEDKISAQYTKINKHQIHRQNQDKEASPHPAQHSDIELF